MTKTETKISIDERLESEEIEQTPYSLEVFESETDPGEYVARYTMTGAYLDCGEDHTGETEGEAVANLLEAYVHEPLTDWYVEALQHLLEIINETTDRKTRDDLLEKLCWSLPTPDSEFNPHEIEGVSYCGDINTIPHGGYFFKVNRWECDGYVSAVEVEMEGRRLTITTGSINRSDETATDAIVEDYGLIDDTEVTPQLEVDWNKSIAGMDTDIVVGDDGYQGDVEVFMAITDHDSDWFIDQSGNLKHSAEVEDAIVQTVKAL